MSDIVIKVEGLGKQYRLGEIGTGTISHDLNRWFARIRGKEDPFAKIGEVNDRTSKSNSDYVWSLKDINFEVKKGEVLGIIGRNGAGKSTLLKILSKVTAPTTGSIKVNGRIASLLEVGTGFHPELTGRENIFLNGAILGMTKGEIRSKFDEIVDFSGVERYIDTPVKRYSSGMYVRLAFAVAAHLEPEILIVDEVLAVGDADFQKKSIGKMQEVSKNDGRTILFVSHSMDTISKLCTKGILLDQGTVEKDDSITEVINYYITSSISENKIEKIGAISKPKIINYVLDKSELSNGNIVISISYDSPIELYNANIGAVVSLVGGAPIFGTNLKLHMQEYGKYQTKSKKGEAILTIIKPLIHSGAYKIDLFLGDQYKDYDTIENAVVFNFISDNNNIMSGYNLSTIGPLQVDAKWKVSLQ